MKKFLLLSFIPLALLILIQCGSYGDPDPVDKFAAKISKELASKYHLKFCGIGGGATKEGVWLVSVRFTFKGKPLEITEGRKLIVEISEEFLEAFNENKDISPLLKVHPFTTENISIGLFMHDFEGNDVFDPYLDIISVSNRSIRYFTQDPDDRYIIKSKTYEPYAEALEKAKTDKLFSHFSNL